MPAVPDTAWPWVVAGVGLAAGVAALAMAGDDDTPVRGVRCVPQLPCGKGVFVRSVRHGGDPDLFVKRMRWYGMQWVMLQAIWQDDQGGVVRNNPNTLAEYAAKLEAAGIEVWLFGWPRPEPEKRRDFVETCRRAASATNAVGIVINPEKPWYRNKRQAAASFVSELRGAFPHLTLGMTSYGGGPPSHPPFPWEEFAELDFGIPQIYDTKHRLGEDYPKRSVERWTKAGYICVPAWGASSAHTADQMADIARRTPLPAAAACWWDLYWLLNGRKESTPVERSEFVRNFKIPGAK